MSNRDSVEMVKEQLRIKKAELKKVGAEKNRQEVKIKHLLAVTSKKINTLQQQLNEKKRAAPFSKIDFLPANLRHHIRQERGFLIQNHQGNIHLGHPGVGHGGTDQPEIERIAR